MRPLRRRPAPVRLFNTGNADDDARLEVLAEDGQLSVPRHWSHFLHFAHEEAARLMAERLEEEWQTQVLESPTGEGWVLQALKEGAVLTAAGVTDARAAFTSAAQTFGGTYDGWQAWV